MARRARHLVRLADARTLTTASASNAATMGLQGSFGSWQDRYSSRELADHTQDQIAWIGSVQLFFMLAVRPARSCHG